MASSDRKLVSLTATLSAAAIAPLVAFQMSSPAKAASFSQIYAFGDSLVDTGNAFAKTGIPPAPYFEGRFSNGPIWNEYLASDLQIAETSFGFGGALSNESGFLLFGGVPVTAVTGTLAQVNSFAANPMGVDPNALYVIWAGANDYFFAGQTNPLEPVGNLSEAVTTLNKAGAENFLLVNLPDLGELPLAGLRGLPSETVIGLNALSSAHNQALAATVTGLNAAGKINVDLLDANGLFKSALAGELGFTNTTDACTLNPICVADPKVQDTYLFWDEVHPTTAAHRVLADSALALVHPDVASVPEPIGVAGFVLAGSLGLHQLKRKSTV